MYVKHLNICMYQLYVGGVPKTGCGININLTVVEFSSSYSVCVCVCVRNEKCSKFYL